MMNPLPEKLKEFIENETWIFAKTYAKTWPHEYLVRDRVDQDLFLQLVRHIRAHGYQGSFYKKPITYFDHDGMVYWTMGGPVEETGIINRCLKEQSYEYKRDHGRLPEQQEQENPEKNDSTADASTLWFPDEVTEVQCICALRFAGYEYESQRQREVPGGFALADVSNRVTKTLTFDDDLHAFAVFFALQRYLFKWGGERLTKYSPEHIAFDFLFLHLYRQAVPQAFVHQGYAAQWQEFTTERIESAAAFARKSFVRQGHGPVFS